MKDHLFNTEKKREAATIAFQTGVSTPIWKLMIQILEANIKVVTKHILDGTNLDGEEATKEELDRLRDKLKVYEEVKDTPERMVKSFASPSGEEPALDPFQTVEQLKEERRKAGS